MGIVDFAIGNLECPSCHKLVEVQVRHKYGAVFGNTQNIGDKVDGSGQIKHIQKCYTDGCPECGYGLYDHTKRPNVFWYVYAIFENDVFVGLENRNGQYQWLKDQLASLPTIHDND